MDSRVVIAIDGPGASGKSTVAQMLARKLGYLYVNTGAMYRAMALKVLRNGISVDDASRIAELTRNTDVTIRRRPDGGTSVFLDGEDVTDRVREMDVTNAVSPVSRVPEVRTWLVEKQRRAARTDNVVCEGRDIGTVVFPSADHKFYVNATLEERAKRRLGEFMQRGVQVNMDDVIRELRERDLKDSTRDISPLRKAQDAVEVDTTHMSPEQVVGKILNLIGRR
jgi:cytidylate kinase